jgi:hypothetical protein
MHRVVQDVNVHIVLVFSKKPFKHVHFCSVHCDQPIEFDLRDIDVQGFCVMLNELKTIFLVSLKFSNYKVCGFFFIHFLVRNDLLEQNMKNFMKKQGQAVNLLNPVE